MPLAKFKFQWKFSSCRASIDTRSFTTLWYAFISQSLYRYPICGKITWVFFWSHPVSSMKWSISNRVRVKVLISHIRRVKWVSDIWPNPNLINFADISITSYLCTSYLMFCRGHLLQRKDCSVNLRVLVTQASCWGKCTSCKASSY